MKISALSENKLNRFLGTLVIALIGGFLFSLIKIPVPWLLGSMTAILITSRFRLFHFFTWPSWIRDIGLIIVGYSMGLSFTKSALLQMVVKLPSMLVMTLTIILFGAGMAYFFSRLTGVDYPTALTGSIPGGLSQIITFAEEVKNIDITTVAFLQVTRVLMIVFFVPLLIFSPLFPKGESSVATDLFLKEHGNFSIPLFILFMLISFVFALLGKKMKWPTPYLLGPIFSTAVLNIIGFEGPPVPSALLVISQLMIGGYIGLLLKPEKLQHKGRIITLALLNGMVMVAASFVLSLLFVHFYHFTPVTAFLSLAPGGADQLGIIAHEVNADLSMVTGYQLFRVFFIYFAVPPLLKWVLVISQRKKQNKLSEKIW
ncbi:AbrB family transcriptional regulator [Neobacillus sp. D3-1R]|uniref:AbrB family transcriptional regulator n=1 Tax=Neobacillus sp. D3-1R TaxID=3445778 RepID=UPI003FA02486